MAQRIPINDERLKVINRKSEEFEAAKDDTISNITDFFEKLKEKIICAENKILEDVRNKFDKNPFATFLVDIDSGDIPTEAETLSVLFNEIPQYFGPDKESLNSLYKEIEALESWQKRKDERLGNVSLLSDCAWKECPTSVDINRKYSVMKDPRIASKIGDDNNYCTIIANSHIPSNKTIAWNVKFLKINNGEGNIYIGVAPSSIDQNTDDNIGKCGWYFCCGDYTLRSGPPHNYRGVKYGSGGKLKLRDSVGVVMDTVKGNLSFIVNGVNRGYSYTEIPLDKPLVPCVILKEKDDSVEFDVREVKENVDSSIPVPSNITTKSDNFDSIAISWDAVNGISFYQIEVNGNNSGDTTTANSFTKTGLLSGTEYNFRVRSVKDNSVSEWSNTIEERTRKVSAPTSISFVNVTYDSITFSWNKVEGTSRYEVEVDGNNSGDTTTANSFTRTGLLPDTEYSFRVRSVKDNSVSEWSNTIEERTRKVPAPTSISFVNVTYDSITFSWSSVYGASRYEVEVDGNNSGNRISTNSFTKTGLLPDTEYSFRVRSVIGSYAGEWSGFIKNRTNKRLSVPSNIKQTSYSFSSITIAWNSVGGASSYQVEFGSVIYQVSGNSFTKTDLMDNSKYEFKVRALSENLMGEWGSVKGQTQKWNSTWKECPSKIDWDKKYTLDCYNHKIATMAGDRVGECDCGCTIIGNTHLLPNKITSWKIKIRSTKMNGGWIQVGVAPHDIDQRKNNFDKGGWFLDLGDSTLRSGPPHNYNHKEYGLKGTPYRYFKKDDIICVNMDTANGNLSFGLNGRNLGVAFNYIPLNKPLVPCVILCYKGDSVELII